MAGKYICIHGHFYQPPRENPWLEAIELQESAYPDHDWNERITRECYAANAKARRLDEQERITELVNNYARISFNFGPTLLAWLADKSPGVYAAILAADKLSSERFGGHGSALAQPYNHMILPLCNDRDRRTQVLWGMRDFESRFGRRPEGMWLPETAVDIPSLEALADAGIQFTILAPRQAAKVRRMGESKWQAPHGHVDTTRAYVCPLPSGNSINLFFYDGPVSQAVAFEGLLHSGDRFADRLAGAFGKDTAAAKHHARLVHIATDGETYGHHHRYGEMALAAALDRLDSRDDLKLTNYGQFLAQHPPEMQVQIHERSSWSCAHGVERWRSDCGCNGGRQGWHQRWRAPLRAALDWLRDSVAGPFERTGAELFRDPWSARDRYIDVILDRTPASMNSFLAEQAVKTLADDQRSRALQLMELQRHAMLMYTSCGWFFNDIGGIETVQILRYAGRVVQLARQALGLDLEGEFAERLARTPGNDPARPDGRAVYEQSVRPAMVDLLRVGAHYAISSMFALHQERDSVYCFDAHREDERRRSAGRSRLLIGRATLVSRITLESARISYAVLHMGEHIVNCGVRQYRGEQPYQQVIAAIEDAFDGANFTEVVRRLDEAFGHTSYSIASLFRDEQHAVVRKILESTLAQIDSSYRQIYEQHAPMARFLKQLELPVPRRIQMVGTFVLTQAIRSLLQQPRPDLVRLRELRDEAQRQGVVLDQPTIGAAAREALERAAVQITASQQRLEDLAFLLELTQYVKSLPMAVDLWPAQEVFVDRIRPRRDETAASQGETAQQWMALLRQLGEALYVKV